MMKKLSIFLLLAALLTALAIPVLAGDVAPTPPPMPTVSMNTTNTATQLPANLGSIIGIALAALLVVAVVVIVILNSRKK